MNEYDPTRAARVDLKLRKNKQKAKFTKRDLLNAVDDDRADDLNGQRRKNQSRDRNSKN